MALVFTATIYLFCRNVIKQDGKPGAQERFKEFMSNKMVLTDYGINKVYQVDDVTFEVNPTHTFDRRGQPVSIFKRLGCRSGRKYSTSLEFSGAASMRCTRCLCVPPAAIS